MIYRLLLVILLAGLSARLPAVELAPPADPRQSITYWKAHSISPDADPQVARSHAIFASLLRSWDSARLAPQLNVVKSTSGPWAASLADGNILLSREAIDTCFEYGEQRGEHLLAFVLAHELAHQRADDLWHQRFFRMVGKDDPDTQRMLEGLNIDNTLLADLEQKEAQADHDGLVMMASSGFDPYRILEPGKVADRDFFTAWVENIWQQHCGQADAAVDQQDPLAQACQQASVRALRARAQLQNVVTQSSLYELGVEAFVAGRYAQAREYFSSYARDYPARAVISALALTHLAEAQQLQRQLIQRGALQQADFTYPLLLDAASAARPEAGISGKRAADDSASLLRARKTALQQAVSLLEKALRRDPDHAATYLLLASAHLLNDNHWMARGILQGRYLPAFGEDAAVALLLAMATAVEGRHDEAAAAFARLLERLDSKDETTAVMPANLLHYAATWNTAALATFRDDADTARAAWERLAQRSRKQGNTLLFRLALAQLDVAGSAGTSQRIATAPTIAGVRLGDRLPDKLALAVDDELWINGDRYRLQRSTAGERLIADNNGVLISAARLAGEGDLAGLLQLDDPAERSFNTLGMPDRRLDMSSGQYLAYDRYGVALHVVNDRIRGWFLYATE